MKRRPCRAGSFYDADPDACRRAAAGLLDEASVPADLPATLYGGLVPHAGWVFSGRTAAATFKALAERGRLDRVVLFGADHWGLADGAAVGETGTWETPLGPVPIDEALAKGILDACDAARPDGRAHAREHSIEVQLPLMQILAPDVRIVPINVSPDARAVGIGRAVGEVLKAFPDAAVVGSTDLTHYGPQYGFVPAGSGAAGIEWARDNDRRILDLVESMRAGEIVPETAERMNACGGGAIAATVAACATLGAARGICLEYTSSAEVMQRVYRQQADDAVGYAAVVFA